MALRRIWMQDLVLEQIGWICDHLHWWYLGVIEEHVEHLKYVLTKFHENKLFAKKAKNGFGQEEIDFLGHILSWEGVKLDPKKLQAIRD